MDGSANKISRTEGVALNLFEPTQSHKINLVRLVSPEVHTFAHIGNEIP
jgi:hypothetical protein